jgi:hypothetical protein
MLVWTIILRDWVSNRVVAGSPNNVAAAHD